MGVVTAIRLWRLANVISNPLPQLAIDAAKNDCVAYLPRRLPSKLGHSLFSMFQLGAEMQRFEDPEHAIPFRVAALGQHPVKALPL